MATLKQTLFFYTKVLGASGLAGYGYLYYHCKQVREEATNIELINAKKDTTRPSNVYYGLNWGYRSDNTIEKSLDTGDLLYFNYNCMNCLQPSEVIQCYMQQKLGNDSEEDPQNIAFAMRTPKRLLIISGHFDGQVHITPYHEFLNKPYIRTVKVRQFVSAPLNIVEATAQFVQQLREMKQAQDKDHKDFFSSTLKQQMLKFLYYDKLAANVVPNYLHSIKVLNRSPFQQPTLTVKDLDNAHPESFHEPYELSSSVMIRTYASKNLSKSNVT
ncbi:hypothetical protein FGO68_gene387 [Halteria grandinella]|uniref:Uncharacterized protein n=1 Tax=Halteria grandinella TaxID=5974 RepID=A0A8J8NJS6_HALGN|nr:hypothetical protein FGO68_gene387 [Halteria grandinella]